MKLTVVDTPGFGDLMNNSDCWKPVIQFIDEQHELYLRQESQAVRKEIVDMRIHACLYFIPPNVQSLRSIDIEAMKELGKRVNLIPVLAKADTISPLTIKKLKQKVTFIYNLVSISIKRT